MEIPLPLRVKCFFKIKFFLCQETQSKRSIMLYQASHKYHVGIFGKASTLLAACIILLLMSPELSI